MKRRAKLCDGGSWVDERPCVNSQVLCTARYYDDVDGLFVSTFDML